MRPTEAQCAAMLEQLQALDERVQQQPVDAGAPPSTRPSRRTSAATAPTRNTTTKVPRAASQTKPVRARTTTKMPRSK